METVGGYRLVRRLGDGERAEVWLGHAGSDAGVAAIKVYRAETPLESIDEEIDALARASSPHLLELLDVGMAPDGRPCLVLPRLPGPTLADTVAERGALAVGELVTVLAPTALAVAELHRVGVAHGAISAAAVILDPRGAPVLARFGKARVVGDLPETAAGSSLTIAERVAEPRLRADLEQFAALARDLLVRAGPVAASLVEWLERAVGEDDFLEQTADRLFELAPAAPITVGRTPGVVARTTNDRPAAAIRADRTSVATAGWSLQSLEVLESNPLSKALDWLKSRAVGVRRPVWLVGLAGLVALVVAFLVIPAVGRPSGSIAETPRPTAVPTNTIGSLADSTALTGDDPVAATKALIIQRARCITEVSAACLAGVDEADSAALDADRFFLREVEGGSTVKDRALDASAVTLVERLGDSAIIGLGAPEQPSIYPESVLVVKTDAGWRIRDLTTGASPG